MKTDKIETLVADPLNPDHAETAARVYADPALWTGFERALYPDAEPTDEELRTIDRVVSEKCAGARARREAALREFVAARLDRISGGMSDFALAAAPGGTRSRASAAAPSAESVTFVFVSDPSDDTFGRHGAWRAEMTLPPDAEVDEMLPIEVSVADDRAADGLFRIAGVALPVMRGRAEIPYGMFLSGLKDANVEFTDAAGVRSHGTLALF